MISIIIPAHNEQAVIERCLRSLLADAADGEFEIIVVANGCSDSTADVARQVEGPICVVETATASKTNALNLGERAAAGFPRVYVDADVVVAASSVRELCRVFERGGVLAAAPSVETVFLPQTSWAVRAYYAFWMALPYIQEGMMAAGVYAVTREGRCRFAEFPEVVSDDGFFRLHFTSAERVEVASAVSKVTAPTSLRDLLKIKTRSRFGTLQLQRRFTILFERESRSKHYRGALMAMLGRPTLYPFAPIYLWVTFLSRLRAKRASLSKYDWERDESSRFA